MAQLMDVSRVWLLGACCAASPLLWSHTARACDTGDWCFRGNGALGYMLLRAPPMLDVSTSAGNQGSLPSNGPMSLFAFSATLGYGKDDGPYFPFVSPIFAIPFAERYPASAPVGGGTFVLDAHSTLYVGMDIAGFGWRFKLADPLKDWLLELEARPGVGSVNNTGKLLLGPGSGPAATGSAWQFTVHTEVRMCKSVAIVACLVLAPSVYEFTWLGVINGGLGGEF
jgi:hypothetical protein